MKAICFWIFLLTGSVVVAQGIDPSLLKMKANLDQVEEARATATLTLDVDFIFMPQKTATLHYRKGKPLDYESDHFIMLPKKGLDFSWGELFETAFLRWIGEWKRSRENR